MQSTSFEPSSSEAGSSKMDPKQWVDANSLKNGIEKNNGVIDQEGPCPSKDKVLLNGNSHEEDPIECDNQELEKKDAVHENSSNEVKVVSNSKTETKNVKEDLSTATTNNSSNKEEKKEKCEKNEQSPEPGSVEETTPSKPEISQEAKNESENLENSVKEDNGSEPEEPMDILGNGLLIKKVLKEGNGRISRPTTGERVTLKTEGKLENGTIVDRNDKIEFVLGDGDVISAWDIAVALMAEKEIAELKCDSKYAYGSIGRLPEIPANATITYTLELLGKSEGPNFSLMSIDERIYHGALKKERGNYLFSRSDYRGAINSYLKAISVIDHENVSFEESPQKLQLLLEDKIKCYNNLAAAQLKVDYYDAAIKSCEGVLKHHPENVKALFRMGKAYAAKGETKEAIIQMKKALKLEPETKIIHQELSKLTKKLSKENQSERNMYKKMFRATETPVKPSTDHYRWKWPVIAGSLAVVLLSVGVAYFRYRQH